jgi:Uma2 family endonuclease
MSTPVASASPPVPPDTNPYRFGYRYVTRPGSNGEDVFDQVPLTLEAVLHPLFGDFITQNIIHNTERDYLRSACEARLRRASGVLVLSDCLIDWGEAGIRPMCPDVAVMLDVADPDLSRDTFYTAREGIWPRLIVEIVVPHTRETDIRKVDLYYQLRIPEYVMIDQPSENGSRSLIHRRWEPTGWVETPGGDNGVVLQAVGLRLCLRDERAVCFDATTGEKILDYHELMEAVRRLKEEHANLQARNELLRKNIRWQEVNATSWQTAQEQTCVRDDVERRIRELEAELRRLRGQSPG